MLHRFLLLAALGLPLACQSTNQSPILAGLQDRQANAHFASLPGSAAVSRPAWSSDYWANARGGASFRWQLARIADEEEIEAIAPFRDYTPGQVEGKNLAMLSPTEKYDLLRGDGKWTMTLAERKRAQSGPQDEAYGLGTAYAIASTQFKPVERVNMKTKNGVMLPFAADDIYALLTVATQQKPPRPILLAARCGLSSVDTAMPVEKIRESVRKNAADRLCKDLSPAIFHATLVHQIAKRDESFMMETEQASVPIVAYESRVAVTMPISAGSQVNTKQVLRVKTVIYYTSDTPVSNFEEDKTYPYETETLVYDLDLNGRGQMIGGRWVDLGNLTELKPDLLWKVSETPKLDDLMKNLYEEATDSFVAVSGRLPDPIRNLPDDKREVLARFFTDSPQPLAR